MATASERVRIKEPFLRLKSESPKFKDILRRKCQRRLQENRWRLFDGRRALSEEQESLSEMVKEDLKELYLFKDRGRIEPIEEELQHWDSIQTELIDEQLKRLIDEYDKILDNEDFLADMLDDLNRVTCPVCQKNLLSIQNRDNRSFVVCHCGTSVQTDLNLPQIQEIIMSQLAEHNAACGNNPQFTCIKEFEESHVYMLCEGCACFNILF